MILRDNAEELALTAQEIGAEVIGGPDPDPAVKTALTLGTCGGG